MIKYSVSKNKEDALFQEMQRLQISEEDLIEKFIKGSGAGGQKINKTSSCVYLIHIPSGIEVKCQKHRSQAMNRFHARRELCEKIAQIQFKEVTTKQAQKSKARRQKQRRSRKTKQKILEQKRIRSNVKNLRKQVI